MLPTRSTGSTRLTVGRWRPATAVAAGALLVAAGVAGAVGSQAAVPGPTASARVAPAGMHSALTRSMSSVPATLTVVGRSSNSVVVNDTSNGVVYLANPGGRAAATVLARNAYADALSGDLVTYRSADGVHRWRLLGTSRSGVVPASWAYLAPDGGLRVRSVGPLVELDYLHLDGTTQTAPLPASFPTGARYDVVAGPDGVAVTASTAKATPKLAYSPLTSPLRFTTLSTAGLPAGARLRCTSIAATAVGCLAPNRVVRVSIGSAADPQISDTSAFSVAVTDGYTSWTSAHSGSPRNGCPCDMISLGADGASLTALAGLSTQTLAAGAGRFFYTSGTQRGSAGVYVTAVAAGGAALVQAAPARPLTASVPTLGPGRAAWVDDSSAGSVGTVRSAVVGPRATAGAAFRVASGASLTAAGVSGLRTVYTAPGRELRMCFDNGAPTTIVDTGTLLGISGTRVLFRGLHGHLRVLDLITHHDLDVTTRLGARSAALWGTSVSYVRADGSVWRVAATGGAPVRLARGTRGATSTAVAAWGDWTAWQVHTTGGGALLGYRNARTLAPAHSITGELRLAGASAGGVLVRTANRFDLHGWAGGAVRAWIAPNTGRGGSTSVGGVPSVDGGLYVSLVEGRPTVSALGTDVVDRPRSLGNPVAPATATRRGGWRLDLPTSAPLSRCQVDITRATFHTIVPCSSAAMTTGEVVARWLPAHGGRATAAGRYRWAVRAANGDGALLAADGGGSATTGTFVLS